MLPTETKWQALHDSKTSNGYGDSDKYKLECSDVQPRLVGDVEEKGRGPSDESSVVYRNGIIVSERTHVGLKD